MANPTHDWYLTEWLKTLQKKQADLVRDLDYNKSTVSLLCSGKQEYGRDDVNAISLYLHLAPYELLMHPEDAMAIRRLRDDAAKVVETTRRFGEDAERVDLKRRKRDGTNG